MDINTTLLEKLEKLSLLKIADDKRDEVTEQLASILSFVENLNELDEKLTSFHADNHETFVSLRHDIPSSSDVMKEIAQHAPKVEDNFFIVPKIIE